MSRIKQLFCNHRFHQKWIDCSYVECRKCGKGQWYSVPATPVEIKAENGIEFIRFFTAKWEFPNPKQIHGLQ